MDSFYLKYPNFNWIYYKEKNAHLIENEITEEDVINNFLKIGIHMKILYNSNCYYNGFEKDNIDIKQDLIDFDWVFYLEYHSDLNAVYNTKHEAINHYLKHGKNEKRLINNNELKIFNFIGIQTKLFVYYSKTKWDLLFQRPHQIIRHYNKKYLKIFITSNDIIKYEEKYNVLIINYKYKDYIFDRYNNIIIYVTDTCLYEEILNLKKNNKNNTILYDLIDAPIDEFKIWNLNLKNMVNIADYVIYSHPELINFLKPIDNEREYYYISNACDYEHFKKSKQKIYPKPFDIPTTDKLILGYYGAFAEWLDFDIIKKYADDEIYHVLMIGGHPEIYNIRFEHQNITWLEHKDYEELPIYLSWFDVCLVPFKDCELIKYVNPCKIWEYKCSEKKIITYNLNMNIEKLETYELICEKLYNLINVKIDIISLFYNNELIVKEYELNIINLNVYNIQFILIYNESNDNTLDELNKLKKYDNVKIVKTNSNGCALGKNYGIYNSRNKCDYLLFLDSDFCISNECINEFIENITNEIKYVSYYGGVIDSEIYISGSLINENTVIDNENEKKYLGGGCSLICNKIVKKYNLTFDEYYDPFIMQDVDYSFQLLKHCKIKKLKMNNDYVKHLGSYTINLFGNDFYKKQLLKNSIYFMNKFNLTNEPILKEIDSLLNEVLYNKISHYYENNNTNNTNNTQFLRKTLLITNKDYYNFYNVDYYVKDIFNIDVFICENYVNRLIIDFDYYLNYYEIIKNMKNIKNIKIEIILNLKNIDVNNYDKLNNISIIYTYSNVYKLILKNIFKNVKIEMIEYKLFRNIENNNEKCFVLIYNEKFNKMYNYLKNKNFNYVIVNENNILNYDKGNIYVDLNNNFEIIKILNKKKYWIITTNNYPNCEIIKENINGNLIQCEYIINEDFLINDIELNINNYIDFFDKKYL